MRRKNIKKRNCQAAWCKLEVWSPPIRESDCLMVHSELNASRFNLWRAVVAMIHADGVIKPHEVNFIVEQTRDLPLSINQRGLLMEDINTPKDMKALFREITHPQDRKDFFRLARAIAWADGHYDEREEKLLTSLGLAHMDEGGDAAILEEMPEDVFIGYDSTAPKGLALANLVRSIIGRPA